MRDSERFEGDALTSRRLIRPSISEVSDRVPMRSGVHRKQAPPEQTYAENYYCIKLNRTDGPNLMIYKHSIRYMFKEEELRQRRRRGRGPQVP